MQLGAVHGSSSMGSLAHQTRERAAFFPSLAHTCVIEDDAPVPKSHRIALPGNPVEGSALREKVTASLEDRGRIIEFLFDPKKNLADVTIETEGDEDLSFEEVTHLLGDFPLYQVGPINLERILE
jgi:hypothetical protein